MTVAELIARLAHLPPGMQVAVETEMGLLIATDLRIETDVLYRDGEKVSPVVVID